MSEKSDGFLCLMKARLQTYCMTWWNFPPRSCCCLFCFNRSEEGKPFWQPESDETIVTNSSYNESFESESATPKTDPVSTATELVTTATGAVSPASASPAAQSNAKKGSSSPSKLRTKLANDVPIAPHSPKSKSPFSSPVRRNSESESEDSFSFTHSETASDQSDVEGRIRALNQELMKRKREADQLKKEAKRRDKERLKAQEASLKKQIEAYDKYIDQVSKEITKEEADLKQSRGSVAPVIRQPSDSKKLAKQKAEAPRTPPGGGSSEPPKLNRSESDSSKSSVEETVISSSRPDVTSPKSPTTAEDVSRKPSPLPGDRSVDSSVSENIYGTPILSKYTSSSSSRRTSEKTSTPDRSASSAQPSFDEKSPVKEDSSEVVDEAIDESVHTDISASASGAMLKLDLGKKDEPKEDDKTSATPTDYQTDTFAPDTARSKTEDIAEESVQSEIDTDRSAKDASNAAMFKLDLGQEEVKVTEEVKQKETPRDAKSEAASEIRTETAPAPDSARSETDADASKALDSVRSDTSKVSGGAPEVAAEERPAPDSARSEKSAVTEDEDDRSYSYSYSESSRSEARDKSKSYSEDFSTSRSTSVTSSSTTRSTVTQSVSKPGRDESAAKPGLEPEPKTPRDAEASKTKESRVSTDTDEDISEHFSDAELPEDIPEEESEKAEGGDLSERDEDSPRLLVLDTTPGDKQENKDEAETPAPESPEKELDLSERLGASGASETEQTPAAKETQEEKLKSADGASEAEPEADESVNDSVSIATDSELERVISSAAAAVEEFSARLEGATGEESSEGSDNIFVTKDINNDEPEPAAPSREIEGKSRTVLLEMLDNDETTTDIEYVTTPRTDDEQEDVVTSKTPEPEVEEVKPEVSPVQKDAAVDGTTRDLLNESFEAMISIHRRKRSSQSEEDDDEEGEREEPVSKLPALIQSQTEKENEAVLRPDEPTPTSPNQESLPVLKDPFDDDLFESKVTVGRKPTFPSFTAEPKTVEPEESDDLDKLYDELGALTGDGDEWFDDDFGLGIKTPPPYKSDKSGTPTPTMKLELQRVVPEPFYAVPHKQTPVRELCGGAVNVYWEKRRYGESWDDVIVPDSYYGNSDLGNDNESTSRRAYKKLVFELTGEILRDIYAEDDEDETGEAAVSQLGKAQKQRRKYFKGRTPPTHPDELLPVVSEHVLGLLKLAEMDKQPPGASRTKKKWSSRKKRDAVDEVLLAELKEEEPQWVDYQQDELAVKMQVADSIFDNLLLECAQSMAGIKAKRQQMAAS